MRPKRIQVLGVPVDCVTMTSALDFADELIASGRPAAVIAVNPEKVMKAREDGWLLKQLNDAALLLPDGIGIVWAARILGLGKLERVAGADFMQELCTRAQKRRYKVFLYGADPGTNAETRRVLAARHRELEIVGSRDGYAREDEMAALIDQINGSAADIVFIALGSPRQELWMAQYLQRLQVKICQGVGGTFDVIAGRVQRAPRSWQALHLEWAYRLIREPKRIARQTALPRFMWSVFLRRLRGR